MTSWDLDAVKEAFVPALVLTCVAALLLWLLRVIEGIPVVQSWAMVFVALFVLLYVAQSRKQKEEKQQRKKVRGS